MRMRHTIIRGLPGCTVFYHIILSTAEFLKKVIKKFFFNFLYKFCPKYFSFEEEFSEILS